MEIKKATRQGIKPLIGLMGLSGGGKTLTALLVGRGLVGPKGKIGLIDTENKRGSIFTDQIPGGYDAIDFEPPFSPERYIEALKICESKGYDIAIIDSTTHEWTGPGGYLDMKEEYINKKAGNDFKKREAYGFISASKMKPKHNKFIDHMLRSPMAIILCFRGKDKITIGKDSDGKTEITKSDHISPIQDSGLIFECLIAGEVHVKKVKKDGREIEEGGYFRCTKYTASGILPLLPKDGEQMGISHGEAIAKWCAAPSGAEPAPAPTPEPETENTDTLEERLTNCEDIEQVKAVWSEINKSFEDNVLPTGTYEILKKIKNTKKHQFDNQTKGDN